MCAITLSSIRNDKLCTGLDHTGKRCKFVKINDTNFCDNHKDLVDYTQDMLDNQKYCKSNNHFRYCGKHDTCIGCRARGECEREKQRGSYVRN